MHDRSAVWSSLHTAGTQVLLCDLQEQIVARSKTTKPDSIAASVEVLCKMAKIFNLPITLSVVPEEQQAPRLLAGLKPFANAENQCQRTSASPFLDEPTVTRLNSQRRKTLLVAGFASEVVVLHAVTGAVQQGYDVIVVVDACGGSSDVTDRAAHDQMRDAGAVISSVLSIATALGPQFAEGKGKETFAAVQTLRLA